MTAADAEGPAARPRSATRTRSSSSRTRCSTARELDVPDVDATGSSRSARPRSSVRARSVSVTITAHAAHGGSAPSRPPRSWQAEGICCSRSSTCGDPAPAGPRDRRRERGRRPAAWCAAEEGWGPSGGPAPKVVARVTVTCLRLSATPRRLRVHVRSSVPHALMRPICEVLSPAGRGEDRSGGQGGLLSMSEPLAQRRVSLRRGAV